MTSHEHEAEVDQAPQPIKHRDSATQGSDGGGDDGTDDFLDPNRWWFLSTCFPLVAGTFGPIASSFNICALASNWRESIPSGMANDDQGIVDISDPRWLLAVNAVSLVVAIIANLALLMQMARRLPFLLAQCTTIIGWYISSFLLIGLVVAANHAPSMALPDGENRTLTQAYYYAIWSAALYSIISSMMILTLWGALAGHFASEFRLTTSQRTLMLQTISYLVFLLGGAGIWHALEGWSYLDAVYWANYTLLTVGLGNIAPETVAGRALLFPYAISGIIVLGLVVGSIRKLVLERGGRKISSRMAEKLRESVVRQLQKADNDVSGHKFLKHVHIKTDSAHRRQRVHEFHMMRGIQRQADRRRRWTALLVSIIAALVLWCIGALFFWITEASQEWTYFQALYFCYVSLLTIGYGDEYPQTNAGKSFYVLWTLLAVPTLTILISKMHDTLITGVRDATLFLGEITVLPGEMRVKDRVMQLFRDEHHFRAHTGSGMAPGNRQQKGSERENLGSWEDQGSSGSQTKADDLEKSHSRALAGEDQRVSFRDSHHYRSLLVKEMRNVMAHVGVKPPREYSYHEWSWFLKLLGEDEEDESHHRDPAPISDIKEHAQGRDGVGRSGKAVKWSWIGPRSPLLGEREEAEWVLDRLTCRLEEELRPSNQSSSTNW